MDNTNYIITAHCSDVADEDNFDSRKKNLLKPVVDRVEEVLEAVVEVVRVAVVAAGKDKRHVDVIVLRLGDEAGVLAHQHRLHVGALVTSELLLVGVSFSQYVRIVTEVHCAVGNIRGACGNAHYCFDIDRRVAANVNVVFLRCLRTISAAASREMLW